MERKCPACGDEVEVGEDGQLAEHDSPRGGTCPASGWAIKGETGWAS